MIKGVAFDFDCTLYERESIWEHLTSGFIDCFGPYITSSLSKEQVKEILRQGDTEGVIADDDWQGIFDRYCKYGLFHVPPSFSAFMDFIKTGFPPSIVLHDDAELCLSELRNMGIKIGMYTNGYSDYSRMKVRATGVDSLIDYFLCSGDIGIEKPDKRGFSVLAKGMGLKLEEIAFVGDHPSKDVLGAKNAGMTDIWIKALVPWPENMECATYTINNLSEVLDIIKEKNKSVIY